MHNLCLPTEFTKDNRLPLEYSIHYLTWSSWSSRNGRCNMCNQTHPGTSWCINLYWRRQHYWDFGILRLKKFLKTWIDPDTRRLIAPQITTAQWLCATDGKETKGLNIEGKRHVCEEPKVWVQFGFCPDPHEWRMSSSVTHEVWSHVCVCARVFDRGE